MNADFMRRVLVAVFVLGICLPAAMGEPGEKAKGDPIHTIREAMMDRDFARAVKLLDVAIPKAKAPLKDELVYLKATALSLQKKYAEANKLLAELIDADPKGAWVDKAQFAVAANHVKLKDFKAAVLIYQRLARRLVSDERKQQVAAEYLKFAEEFFAPTAKDKTGLPKKPDYNQAYNFFKLAMDMGLKAGKRDEVQFKMALCQLHRGSHANAARELKAYLAAVKDGKLDGKFGFEATFSLGVAHFRNGNLVEARKAWRDLIDATRMYNCLHPSVNKALYLISRTYNIPSPRSKDDLELGTKALADFLAAAPKHELATQAEYEVALSYFNRGRDADAVEKFAAFIKKYAGKTIAYRDANDLLITDAQKARNPKVQTDFLVPLARWNLGQALARQKKFDEAIKVWEVYLAQHPSDKNWSNVQRQIVQTRYNTAVGLLTVKKYAAARKSWTDFMTRYPLDGRNQRILFTFGKINHDRKKWNAAIADWRLLVSKHPGTNESSHGQYMIGLTLEEKIKDLPKALDEYRKLTWGQYAGQARSRIGLLTRKSLTVLTERTFRTSEKATVKVTTRNVEKVTVKAYKLDLVDYFRKMHVVGRIEALDLALIDPNKTWDIEVGEYAKYKAIESQIEVPMNGPGVWAVNVSSKTFESTTLVIRSDIDVLIKNSRKEAFVFAENMVTGKPAAGVKLLISDGSDVFIEGVTGKDGVFRKTDAKFKKINDVRVFAYRDGHNAGNLLSLSGLYASSGLSAKGYIYADRSAYRPGQTVNLRAVVREVTDGSYHFAAGEKWTLDIIDSQGRVLSTGAVKLSEFGTANQTFELPENTPLGSYRVMIRKMDKNKKTVASFAGTFTVQRYKLEKVKLAFELPRRVYFRGEKVSGKIVAKYYYGEPVVGKQVEYVLADGVRRTAKTDEKGEVKFEMETRRFSESQQVRLTARLSAENVSATERFVVAVRAFAASLRTVRDVYLTNEKFAVVVKTIDAMGKKTAEKMVLTVLKREKEGSVVSEVKVSEHKLTTDKETGEGSVTVSLKKGGDYVLRAVGEDRFGNPVSAERAVFVSGDDDKIKLRIITRKQLAKVGETLRVDVHSRLDKSLAVVTFEGEGILSYRLVNLKKGRNAITLKVDHEHFPNFVLSVAVMSARKLHTASYEFTVDRKLNVTITPSKKELVPGEKLVVNIKTTDQLGKPVSAELSLAMVDQALFALFADRYGDIGPFFRGGRRQAAMRTTSSVNFKYTPSTKRISSAILAERDRMEEEVDEAKCLEKAKDELRPSRQQLVYSLDSSESQLRKPGRSGGEKLLLGLGGKPGDSGKPGASKSRLLKNIRRELTEASFDDEDGEALRSPTRARMFFPETGYWNPSVVTNKNGKAAVTITAPDSTTMWRLMARGVTAETLTGQSTASVVTRKDFFVTLRTPPVLVVGDQPRIVVTVHYLKDVPKDKPITVAIKLKVGAGAKAAEQVRNVKITKRGAVEAVFETGAIAAAVGEARIEAWAVAGKLTDYVKLAVPLRARGIEFYATAAGTSRTDITEFLKLPAGQEYSSRKLRVLIGPSVQQTLIDIAAGKQGVRSSEFVARTPSTGASAASELLAVLSVCDFLTKTQQGGSVWYQRLSAKVATLVTQLTTSQRSDGGWAWAGVKAAGDQYVSSRTLWALAEAKRAGFHVPGQVVDKAVKFLAAQFRKASETDYEGKAILLHGLATAGKADYAAANRLYRMRDSLSVSAMAHLTLVFASLDRKATATELAGILKGKVKLTTPVGRPRQCNWFGKGNQAFMASDIETTAMALLAIESVLPTDPIVKQAVEWLLARRAGYRWYPSKATGAAAAALSAYYATAKFADNRYTLVVSVNGKQVGEKITVEGAGESVAFEVDPKMLSGKPRAKVAFDVEGRGEFSYTATLTGVADPKNRDLTSGEFRVERWYEPAQLEYKGKSIRRGFGVLTGSYSTWRNKLTQLPVGVMGTVTVRLRRRYYDHRTSLGRYDYLVMTEPLPAGAVVLADSIRGSFEHYEIGDGEIRFYLGRRRYLSSITYKILGYLPGKYAALPTVVRSVYRPQLIYVGEGKTITVLPRGEKSSDKYRMTPDELYYMGKALFDDKRFAKAGDLLTKLFNAKAWRLGESAYKEASRMLLFIAIEQDKPAAVVRFFEILKEKYPQLTIPFDKIVKVGSAYVKMQEYERGLLVFKATVDSSFVKESQVAKALEQQGQFAASVDFMIALCASYPDTAVTESALFSLSQLVYETAGKVKQIKDLREKKVTKAQMIAQAVKLLKRFLTHFPTNPAADQAGLSMANAFLELEDFPTAIRLTEQLERRYPKSTYLDSFQYTRAYCNYALGKFDAALKLSERVATGTYALAGGAKGPSKNKWLAYYIMGQIYHSRNMAAKAIEFYKKVATRFADAKQSITYFDHKALRVPEITTFKPGEAASVEITYRNIKAADVKVYRVDLMKLYLLHKNLDRITKINLAGIAPQVDTSLTLGDGKDYADKKKKVNLKLTKEGAYLVVIRGESLNRSGMVLISPLTLDVTEDVAAGRIRVNVKNTKTGDYAAKVHVKAIGTGNGGVFQSGETDLRGIYVAERLRGKSTVIAKDADGRFAFFRGKESLGGYVAPLPRRPRQQKRPKGGKLMKQSDMLRNVSAANKWVQKDKVGQYRRFQQETSQAKGVQVFQAK